MTAALGNAIQNNENIVVTSWTPHWMFARWDLKYLDDPKEVYGGAEQIHTITRKGLKEDLPEAYAILSNFNWTPEDMGEVMLMAIPEWALIAIFALACWRASSWRLALGAVLGLGLI